MNWRLGAFSKQLGNVPENKFTTASIYEAFGDANEHGNISENRLFDMIIPLNFVNFVYGANGPVKRFTEMSIEESNGNEGANQSTTPEKKFPAKLILVNIVRCCNVLGIDPVNILNSNSKPCIDEKLP